MCPTNLAEMLFQRTAKQPGIIFKLAVTGMPVQ
jgi:hypothetical protein